MKNNKYLKELGLEWYDLPGNYKKKLENNRWLGDRPAADCRNKEDEEGFCEYEFFNLGYTFDLFVYSKLCYFREYIAHICTPGRFITNLGCGTKESQEKDTKIWLGMLDDMIEGFKLSIVGENDSETRYKIIRARQLLAEYWDCLWF
jgi:hypothetical protein